MSTESKTETIARALLNDPHLRGKVRDIAKHFETSPSTANSAKRLAEARGAKWPDTLPGKDGKCYRTSKPLPSGPKGQSERTRLKRLLQAFGDADKPADELQEGFALVRSFAATVLDTYGDGFRLLDDIGIGADQTAASELASASILAFEKLKELKLAIVHAVDRRGLLQESADCPD